MDRERRGKLYVVLIILVLFIAAGAIVFTIFSVMNTNPPAIPESTVSTTDTQNQDLKLDGYKDSKAKNPINFKSLHKRNDEIVAWISVPGTKIDYPVVQSLVADDFYLHRDINKNSSYAGSIYMEYCNSSDFTDRVTVLYGHNMINGSMFANLHKFEDAGFFNKHKLFYVYLPDSKLTYKIVSAYVYDDRHIMNSFNFAEDEIFADYLKDIQNPRSLNCNYRKLNRKLTLDDKVLTLSTCLNSGDGRYLLQGVLVKNELTR